MSKIESKKVTPAQATKLKNDIKDRCLLVTSESSAPSSEEKNCPKPLLFMLCDDEKTKFLGTLRDKVEKNSGAYMHKITDLMNIALDVGAPVAFTEKNAVKIPKERMVSGVDEDGIYITLEGPVEKKWTMSTMALDRAVNELEGNAAEELNSNLSEHLLGKKMTAKEIKELSGKEMSEILKEKYGSADPDEIVKNMSDEEKTKFTKGVIDAFESTGL